MVGAEDGDNGTVVAAAVVPRGDSVLDGEDLRAQVRSRCRRTRCRSSFGSRTKDALPFTATGKVKKSDLAEQLSELLAKR